MEIRQPKSQVFAKNLELTLSKLNKNEADLVQASFGNSNDRQKLKTIKRVLQTPSDSELKTIFKTKFQELVMKEYIFGNIQSKPTVLNMFKVLPIHEDLFFSLKEELTSFQQIKLTIQVIETLTIANKLTKESKEKLLSSDLFDKIYAILIAQMSEGVESIVKNQFRTKWLDFFVQVLRCINYMIKYTGLEIQKFKQYQQKAYQLAQKCVSSSYMLSKQVISQLYIALITLNKNLPVPQTNLQKIHYIHACTVVKGENTLKPLLKLASELKDTQQKNQLTPILLKSFQQFFEQAKKKEIKAEFDEELKNNAFDWAISLFDVGRSIYSYLEEIIDIIITHGGAWSLEGNFTRKFFITKVALKHVSSKHILNIWPNCLEDCFVQSGNMTMAYVTDCAEALLSKMYEELGKDYEKWMGLWIQAYKKTLLSASRSHIRGITEFINPIILKINSSNSLLLKQISLLPQQNLNSRLGIIALLKCYKQIGKIESKHNVYFEQEERKKQQQKAKKKQLKKAESNPKQIQQAQSSKKEQKIIKQRVTDFNPKQANLSFVHLDDSSFELDSDFLLDLLLSNDPMAALQTLQFLITTRKPSILILPQQMDLIFQFYRNCLKTSMPEYRKCYLNLTKRLLQRFRKNYEKDLKEDEPKQNKKEQKATEYFVEFVAFLNNLIELCFLNIYPDAIFQIANPGLEILLLILNLFGPKGCEIRKGTYIEPCQLLAQKTKFFTQRNFSNLVICLQSSYQSIRSISHTIIKSFTNFSQEGEQTLRKMWYQAIQNTNKLSIKSYQFACRILTYISSLKINGKCLVKEVGQKYSLTQLNVCQYLIAVLRVRYEVFKKQFIDQGDVYYQNLIHGILTCFSYILDELANQTNFTEKNLEDCKLFLAQFFNQMTKILNFSVEISSANISTVVLDTIANASQTDKKMTVDCRGHFLVQKKDQPTTGKTVGSYLDSTALLTSMQNEEQGIENTLVVSFYLLTRQSGLVFQSIGSVMGNPILAKHVPKKQLIQLVNTYFFALINLKHMGSVDRISNGLSKMAKVIFDQEDTDLTKIPEQLLNQLIQFLTDGKFTNILRRSAGVPYAFSCLLKSQAIKRKLLIEKTINSLLNLSREESNSPIELRIHSLNILKKLFQDSDLKQDLDIYLSEAFISSIRGFTSEQWGVRNSSLMLFSVLANRTLGIKPTFNLLQFFHKCPDLLAFITKQLAEKRAPTMYPPLYPIVLLLSRLLPFDLRERARLSVKGGTNKQMRKQQLLNLQPLVRQAGNNHNYMGRVMTAKAILPFMFLSNILPHCIDLLETYFVNLYRKQVNNNNEHYRLTQCYQLLASYYQITNGGDSYNSAAQISHDVRAKLKVIIEKGCEGLGGEFGVVAPTVHEIYVRIFNHILDVYFPVENTEDHRVELHKKVLQNAQKLLSKLTENSNRIGDLGHSLMYKSCVRLVSTCYKNLSKCSEYEKTIGSGFIDYLNCQNSLNQNSQTDYQILCLVLEKTVELISFCPKLQIQHKLAEWLRKMDISKIRNDDTIIKILSIYTANPKIVEVSKIANLEQVLRNIEAKSENKHMKVAIFQYLLAVSGFEFDHQLQASIRESSNNMLQSLLDSYSNPEQLEDLRQCCILYLQKAQKLKTSLFVVYLRMLQDEQYEIRKRAANELSRLLNIKPCNQQVVAKELLYRILAGKSYIQSIKSKNTIEKDPKSSNNYKELQMNNNEKVKLLTTLLSQNSDYKIRQQNDSQSRIFSYDKPNKYRTDINTIVDFISLLSLHTLQQYSQQEHKSVIEQKVEELVKKYNEQIMERNQYQFQTIIRVMIASCHYQYLGILLDVSREQPMLELVYGKCVGL